MVLAFCLSIAVAAQDKAPEYIYAEASELTLTGKVFPDTPNPYHRIDTARFHGFTKEELRLVTESAGIAVAFKTDSPSIRVWPKYSKAYFGGGTTGFAGRGFDLYIKKDGKWLWAASGLQNDNSLNKPVNMIKDMDDSVKECLLYLPVRSVMDSVRIGVEKGRILEPLENPFRHRVAVLAPVLPTEPPPQSREWLIRQSSQGKLESSS